MFSINSLFREKRTKAKLLLRELKTVKADFALPKERCTQLEDKNRILRASREKDDNTEDDDLVSDLSLKRKIEANLLCSNSQKKNGDKIKSETSWSYVFHHL
ncbi:hypothetical protein ACS0TY_006011 [Phlomoides rotata]